jgi:hypothetical protein
MLTPPDPHLSSSGCHHHDRQCHGGGRGVEAEQSRATPPAASTCRAAGHHLMPCRQPPPCAPLATTTRRATLCKRRRRKREGEGRSRDSSLDFREVMHVTHRHREGQADEEEGALEPPPHTSLCVPPRATAGWRRLMQREP